MIIVGQALDILSNLPDNDPSPFSIACIDWRWSTYLLFEVPASGKLNVDEYSPICLSE